MEDIRYPIGKLSHDKSSTPEKRAAWIRDMAEMPGKLRQAVAGLSPAQVDTPYRDGGWTIRQTVHHLADSHMNAFIRIKLALTEANPTIKAYDQAAWAGTPDGAKADVALSLSILDGLHARLSALLSSLGAAEMERTVVHPERGLMTIDHNLQIYAWHGRHHTAHILGLRERAGWR
jgi:uncharacterized damage-inducible protein DinB